MAVALMDYSSLCLTALGVPADAAQQRLFGKVIKKADVILAFICNNPVVSWNWQWQNEYSPRGFLIS